MKGKKILAGLLAAAMVLTSPAAVSTEAKAADTKKLQVPVETVLAKSELGNPFLGFDENGQRVYGGDPSILVDGDTVYAYVGNDTASGEGYWMPNWRCYSSTDMVHWKYESIIMQNKDVSWAANDHEAWAAQVIKYKDSYYFYYCTEGNSSVGGGKCVGVAKSDSPTGPFVDKGQPLVRNIDTPNGVHTWEDIDPTAWVETVDGEEHRVLGWGNNRFFNCELNEDMMSIKDRDGNPNSISCGYGAAYDISVGKIDGKAREKGMNDTSPGCLWQDKTGKNCFYTEAPYYYRQQDEDGNYYGPYYMFFATNWREEMAYATCDTYEQFLENDWNFGGRIMLPTSTANTNHMAVFDFKGQPYFVYHNGTLPHGSGYRRVACVEKLNINEDGSIDMFTETSTGISGVTTTITDAKGASVAHVKFDNTNNDSEYPMVNTNARDMLVSDKAEEADALWELEKGKADPDNDAYVSIQSYNKPGLYITAEDTANVTLAQQWDDNATGEAKVTFRTLEGFAGYGVTFESVYRPGYYLASVDGDLVLTDNPDADSCSFNVDTDSEVKGIRVQKTKRMYTVGSKFNADDIRIQVTQANGDVKWVTNYTTNASEIDTSKAGRQTLTVTYTHGEQKLSENVTIYVVEPGKTKAVKAQADEAPKPVAVYSFEDSLDGSTARVVSNTSDYTKAITYEAGKAGKAVNLNGFGLRLNTGKIGSDYTISLWVKPTAAIGSHSSLIYMGQPGSGTEYWTSFAGVQGGGSYELWSKGGEFSWTSAFNGISIPTNQWTLVTLTQSGNDAVLYLNGQKQKSGRAADALAQDNSDIYIGVNNWDPLYQGLADEVQVYDQVLTDAQVAALYPSGSAEDIFKEKGFTASKDVFVYAKEVADFGLRYPAGVSSTDVKVTCTSDNESVATAKDGVVTGVKEGTAKITVTVKVGSTEKSQTVNLTVGVADISSLKAVVEEAKALKESMFTEESYAAFKKVMDSLPEDLDAEVTSEKQAEELEAAIREAASGLVYVTEYRDPWVEIEKAAPALKKVIKTGTTQTLFEVPEAAADYVSVSYSSDNEEVASYKDGVVTAKADGTAVLTATVTSLYDGWKMEYGTTVEVAAQPPYTDTEKGAWYYDAVAYNYYAQTMTGLKSDTFGPAETLVRAQFAAVLHKMNAQPEMKYTDKFPDVIETDWFKDAVLWAAENKIVTGYTGTGMFGPNDNVTRAQMATMMYRYAKDFKGYDVKADGDYNKFPDAGDVQEFAKDAMKWAVSEEIITGKTINGQLLLDPQGSANRAECATIIQRFMEKYEK